jgi:hypothetical protein
MVTTGAVKKKTPPNTIQNNEENSSSSNDYYYYNEKNDDILGGQNSLQVPDARDPSPSSHKNLEEPSRPLTTEEFFDLLGYSCYYCDYKTEYKERYERHVINKHGLGHPCYPSKADIERLGLKAQGKDWET